MSTIQNTVKLIGFLGKNPEMKICNNGNKVAKILLATSEYRKNIKGEKQTTTIWHNLTAWGKYAILSEKFLIKGKQIAIIGNLKNRMYINKDGIKKTYTEIIISDLQMIA